MGAKFTSGPWKVTEEGTESGRWPVIISSTAQYSDGSAYEVARLDTVKVRRGKRRRRWVSTPEAAEITADAHLIAAAPAMYEALKELRGAASENSPAMRKAAALADAALAAADGSAPPAAGDGKG